MEKVISSVAGCERYPSHNVSIFSKRKHSYVVCVFVINEGAKLLKELQRMLDACTGNYADIVIADGGSTDGSTSDENMLKYGVRALLVKNDIGKLGAQMRMAFHWAIEQGYEGVVVVDGNNKDSVESIPDFVSKLKDGYGHVQGSRFVPGGHHLNTPRSRLLGLWLLHAPLMRLCSGFPYTDTTNGFRAYSADLLKDSRVDLFRPCFVGYELHYYLALKAPKNGYKCVEIPVSRVYPSLGPTPTKISPIRGSIDVILKLFKVCFGGYNSKRN